MLYTRHSSKTKYKKLKKEGSTGWMAQERNITILIYMSLSWRPLEWWRRYDWRGFPHQITRALNKATTARHRPQRPAYTRDSLAAD